MKTNLFLKTTMVSPQRTLSEIQEVLGRCGARQVQYSLDTEQRVDGIAFIIGDNKCAMRFKLPCRWHEIGQQIRQSQKRPRAGTLQKIDEQAYKTGLRIMLYWLKVEEVMMLHGADIQERFFAYITQLDSGADFGKDSTLYEHFKERGLGMQDPRRLIEELPQKHD